MKIYFAPLEGVTGHIYRNAYEEFYGKGRIDKYFVPFISPNQTKGFTAREQRDMKPENNKGLSTVVQIMTNRADYFLNTAELLYEKGYKALNLNLGCPSGTVVAKKRGAGFLSVPDELDEFFENVYESSFMQSGKVTLSVKTRLGVEACEEFDRLLDIYNKYPLEELIIHPRVQKDYYKNKPNLDCFAKAVEKSVNPVCYNGDIFTLEDYKKFKARFKTVERIMIGRGFIGNPSLLEQLIADDCGEEKQRAADENKRLLKFHDRIYHEYLKIMPGDKNAIHKMKEIWFYQKQYFDNAEKSVKKIKKSQRMSDYEAAVQEFFAQAIPTEKDKIQF